MARKLRLQVAGGIYHLTSRGDREEEIVRDDVDCESFLTTLGEACARTEWKVHAYCVLPNHFHVLVETPQQNLVSGMKWMLGTYTTRFNRRHGESGHVFAGRYRSQLIDPAGRYLSEVGDYVHLNPVRSGLISESAALEEYRWSSYGGYVAEPETRPAWLQVSRILGQLGYSDDPAGRQAYRDAIEARRRASDAGTWNWIRTGWFLGGEEFRQRLLEHVASSARGDHSGVEVNEAAAAKAGRIIDEELRRGLWDEAELIRRRKGDPFKIEIAHRLRRETTVTLQWIASRLHMGTRAHLSHLLYWDVRDRRDAAKGVPEKVPTVASGRGSDRKKGSKRQRLQPSEPTTPAESSPRSQMVNTIPITDPIGFDTSFD